MKHLARSAVGAFEDLMNWLMKRPRSRYRAINAVRIVLGGPFIAVGCGLALIGALIMGESVLEDLTKQDPIHH